jgi:ADP-ribose pyrophosphatase YjhB (NUDIX family)
MSIAKIPPKIFETIEQYAPFSSVDIIIEINQKIILTKRAISPYRGYWHLPGSIILKNEPILNAVERSVREELGINIIAPQFLGIYELFTRKRHYITHTFVARYRSGDIRNDWQSTKTELFLPRKIPVHTIPIQKRMILDALRGKLLT